MNVGNLRLYSGGRALVNLNLINLKVNLGLTQKRELLVHLNLGKIAQIYSLYMLFFATLILFEANIDFSKNEKEINLRLDFKFIIRVAPKVIRCFQLSLYMMELRGWQNQIH